MAWAKHKLLVMAWEHLVPATSCGIPAHPSLVQMFSIQFVGIEPSLIVARLFPVHSRSPPS